ncbi:MAG TPA: MltA domain-containing protein [Usitatibacteraceae bacterium]|nr:MltA domain-containing protein [Usitatibacteraceae bacterium]
MPLAGNTGKRTLGAALLVLGACAAPQAPCPVCQPCAVCAPAPASAPVQTAPAPSITPVDEPLVPEGVLPSPEAPRGRLQRLSWEQVPLWPADGAAPALTTFQQSCSVLGVRAEWALACTQAGATPAAEESARRFFRENFEPFAVLNADGSDNGLLTGYYEPVLRGSRKPGKTYRFPIYGVPQDLLTVDLAETYPDLKFRRLRGRLVGNKLVPYYERGDIDGKDAPLKGLEIAWVDDAVELYYLHIQGSGQILLPDGTRMRVGYADQNGHPFRSTAGLLIRRGEIRAENATLNGIREWVRRNPSKARRYLNANPSYVFFKELPADLPGPIGTLGVPLVGERSIAVDPRVIPLGVPLLLSTTRPGNGAALNRLMVAQDTGGAIAGGVRGDFYWGSGDEAGFEAGRTKQKARMWVLLPKGYEPEAFKPAAKQAP